MATAYPPPPSVSKARAIQGKFLLVVLRDRARRDVQQPCHNGLLNPVFLAYSKQVAPEWRQPTALPFGFRADLLRRLGRTFQHFELFANISSSFGHILYPL